MKGPVLVVGILVLIALASPVAAHPGHAIVGEVVSVAADSLEIRTAKGTVTFKLSEKTVFELKKKPVDASALKKGDRVSVTASKQASGEMLATKVVLGIPAPKPATTTETRLEARKPGV
jgi:hypothetical protein